MKSFCVLAMMVLIAGASFAQWDTFVIRQGGGADPAINDVTVGGTAAKEFVISAASMKAGWGTNSVNGLTLGELTRISIERLDDTTRYPAGSGPAGAPYFNIWVTDGAGNYAVIANEPSNSEWTDGSQWNMDWDTLSTKTAKVFETPGAGSNASWVHTLIGKSSLTFADLASLLIEAPSAAYIQDGANAVGTGAPRVLGTDYAYGFNWVFGDTQSNYLSGDDGYIVANPTVVPEPATLAILAIGGVCLVKRRK